MKSISNYIKEGFFGNIGADISKFDYNQEDLSPKFYGINPCKSGAEWWIDMFADALAETRIAWKPFSENRVMLRKIEDSEKLEDGGKLEGIDLLANNKNKYKFLDYYDFDSKIDIDRGTWFVAFPPKVLMNDIKKICDKKPSLYSFFKAFDNDNFFDKREDSNLLFLANKTFWSGCVLGWLKYFGYIPKNMTYAELLKKNDDATLVLYRLVSSSEYSFHRPSVPMFRDIYHPIAKSMNK